MKRDYKNFLPPEKLNMTPKEREAAILVLKMLEQGHIQSWNTSHGTAREGCRFDMGQILKKHECGTVGCLAGWMAHYMGKKTDGKSTVLFNTMVDRSEELHKLFYAEEAYDDNGGCWIEAQAKHGARALRHYLKTGKSNWRKAMGKDA